MRKLAFAVVLISVAFAGRDALAQSFWYTPPGYELGYYYGLDLGYGVGFGYGAGVGVPLSPDVFMQTRTGNIPEPQFNPEAFPSSQVAPVVQWQMKNKGPKAKVAKGVTTKTKNSKAMSHKAVQKSKS